ncbi:MAG: TRAP transporter large permease [Burkholderiaceae bacterium]|nr:TRAP transporter large permease [Burkholderiaceae bacterium]
MIAVSIFVSFVLLAAAVPIFLVFGIGSSIVAVAGLGLPWATLLQVSFGALTKQLLLAIPLFIFAGFVMVRGGMAARLVNLCLALVGHWRGGLAMAMVLAIAAFGAFSGSVLAAISAIGTAMMPRMAAEGYPRPFIVVLAATAALIDALIPPSNAAIIYSSLTSVPVSKTFAAGVLPGILLTLLLMSYVRLRCRHMPAAPRASWAERGSALIAAIPSLTTPLVILGGIYLGILTAAESAAVAGMWAIIVGFFVHRQLTLRGLGEALVEAATGTAIIFAIIATATFLSVVATYTRAPQAIIEYVIGFGTTPLMFMFALALVCLILGTFIEVVPIFYLVIPLTFGLVSALQIDMIHLYIVFAAFVGLGLLTPPVCVGVYTASAVIREPPERSFRELPGFLAVGIFYGVIMILFPKFATWLPGFV